MAPFQIKNELAIPVFEFSSITPSRSLAYGCVSLVEGRKRCDAHATKFTCALFQEIGKTSLPISGDVPF